MRGHSTWRAWLLTAGVALLTLAPGTAYGQNNIGLSDPEWPLPLGHDRLERGGFFMDGRFIMLRGTNPLEHQLIATRGFFDADGSVTGFVGRFFGSNQPALDAKQAGGPGSYVPGFSYGMGWRFHDGSAVEANYLHLFDVHTFQVATLVPQFFNNGPQLENTFLTAPTFNFSNDYAGPAFKVDRGNPFAIYGIWNGASVMSIDFLQRFDQAELTYRDTVYENECYRAYGLVGPRFDWVWERFRWRTVSENSAGQASPFDVAVYTNIVSNRMYGAHAGIGHELYLGHGFACSVEGQGALLLDVVKERAKYELGQKDFPGQVKRSIVDYTVVPEVEVKAQLHWYPIEGVQMRLGYDLMTFFNTVASPHPIDFNVGSVTPAFQRQIRFYDGLEVGLALIF